MRFQRTKWRGQDSNLRPRGYEPRELPGCSTPRQTVALRPVRFIHRQPWPDATYCIGNNDGGKPSWVGSFKPGELCRSDGCVSLPTPFQGVPPNRAVRPRVV